MGYVLHVATVNGSNLQKLAAALAPSQDEARNIVAEMLNTLGTGHTSALLVLPVWYLKHFTAGRCGFNKQTRKLAWCVWALTLRRNAVRKGLDLVTCSRFSLDYGPQHAPACPRQAIAA